MNLTKKYRISWKGNQIIVVGEFDKGTIMGCDTCFESDSKEEINQKIKELNLQFEDDEMKKEWYGEEIEDGIEDIKFEEL